MKKAGFILFPNMLGSFLAAQHVIKFNKIYSVLPGRPCFSDRIYECPGGYMIYGGTRDSNGLYKVVMLKIDTLGNLLWKKSYGKNGYNYYDESIIPGGGVSVPWGGYIEPGSISSLNVEQLDLALYRFDSEGDTVWTRIYNDSTDETGITVKVTREKQYIIGGEWANFKGSGFYTTTLKKTDTLGNTIWQKTYHGLPSHYRESLSLDTCKDEGYIICAFDGDTNYGYNCGGRIFIMKTDSSGTPQWTKYISDPFCYVIPTYIVALHDGSYLVCGCYVTATQSNDAIQFTKLYLAKLSSTGIIKWTKQYGSGNWYVPDELCSLKELPNGDIIASGIDSSNYLGCILKIDSNGNQKWLRYYNKLQNPASGTQYLLDIQPTTDGGYVAAGTIYHDTSNIWVVKVDSLGCDTVGCDFTGVSEVSTKSEALRVFPNPNNGNFTLQFSHAELISASQVEIYNVLGMKIYNETLKPVRTIHPGGQVQGDSQINLSSQPNGVYFYRVVSENGELVGDGKVVIQK